MSKVRILDDLVVNQIAAGEVVERPASVVKELVENSIDAGASEITVVVTQGGSSSIEVIDNGEGMNKSDALLAIERFGTSKISAVDDLLQISTHGFRGEAIPSIASVSRFKLETRRRDDAKGIGTDLSIVAGKLQSVTEKQMGTGTRIQVQQLFMNVPARRRFLRSDKTEAGLIKTQIQDFAAAYSHIRFKLVSDGSEVLNLGPAASFRDRLQQLGLNNQKSLFIDKEAKTEEDVIRVSGTLSEPVEAVVSSSKLRLLVNGRSVRDRLVLKAIRDGYGSMIKPGRYPTGLVKIDVSPTDVDVNVHPQKTEVRFRAPERIYQLVVRAVANALSTYQPTIGHNVSEMSWQEVMPDSLPFRSNLNGAQPVVFDNPMVMSETMSFDQSEGHVTQYPTAFAVPAASLVNETLQLYGTASCAKSLRYSTLRYVGQVMACYLIMEGAENLVILDMHAAHERVTFYRLKRGIVEGHVASQALLIPEQLVLDGEDYEKLELAHPILSKLGFVYNLSDDGTLCVSAVPAVLGEISIREVFQDMLSLPVWQNWNSVLDRHIDDVIARIACHGSIRSGRLLQKEEAYELLAAIDEAQGSAFCPHGRPVAKVFSKKDVEMMFGRIL